MQAYGVDTMHTNGEFPQLDEYLDYLRSHGRKDLTIETYRSRLSALLRILREGGRPTDIFLLTETDIFWLDAVTSERMCESSRKMILGIFGRFCAFISGHDIVKQASILYNDGSPQTNVHWISKEQLSTLYRVADPTARMILVLGAYMGLRRAEMTSIKDSDITGSRMVVHGKGHGKDGKVRIVDIPDRVMTEIEAYREWKSGHWSSREQIYLLEGGQAGECAHGLKPASVGRMINGLKRETGIQFTTHSLRRFFATTLYYDVGADIVTVQHLMRHSKSSTTSLYIESSKKLESDASASLSIVLDEALGII